MAVPYVNQLIIWLQSESSVDNVAMDYLHISSSLASPHGIKPIRKFALWFSDTLLYVKYSWLSIQSDSEMELWGAFWPSWKPD